MKKVLCLSLGLCMMFSLFACGGTDTNISSDNVTPTEIPNMVLATDQKQERLVVYDLNILKPGDSLDLAEVWSYDIGEIYIAGLKYREDTVFGDVILAVGDDAYMISYPEKKLLWQCTDPGKNPHCIEILPNGDIAIGLAQNGDAVRLFNTSVLAKGGSEDVALKFTEVPLKDCHGVLYDPEKEILWAVGQDDLIALQCANDGTPSLTLLSGEGAYIARTGIGGHAICPDLSNPNYIYISSWNNVIRYDKETRKVERVGGVLNRGNIKGMGIDRNGNVVFCFPDGKSTYGWRTHTIHYHSKEMGARKIASYTSKESEFYKVVLFDGKYL